MGSFVDSMENTILNLVFRNGTYTPPATVFVGLCTSTPTDATGGTEVTGNNYARTAATFGAASGGQISNSGAVTFPTPTGSWGTVTAFEVWDAASAGNRIAWGMLTTSQAIGLNNSPAYAIGALVITLD